MTLDQLVIVAVLMAALFLGLLFIVIAVLIGKEDDDGETE